MALRLPSQAVSRSKAFPSSVQSNPGWPQYRLNRRKGPFPTGEKTAKPAESGPRSPMQSIMGVTHSPNRDRLDSGLISKPIMPHMWNYLPPSPILADPS